MAQKREFKLKSVTELVQLLDKGHDSDIIIYIDQLHSIIKDYQIVIDDAVRKNKNIY